MSPFQQAQMFSLQDANIHNIAIEGVFDDCQDIVKAVSQRPGRSSAAQDRHGQLDQLGAARRPQVVLLLRRLLSGHARATTEQVSFAVPSGNFGNICAGHVARHRWACPSRTWWSATNENDVLDEFFRTGTLPRARQPPRRTQTSSPSMDISKASQLRALRVRPAGPRRRRCAAVERGPDDRATVRFDADAVRQAAGIAGYGFVSGRSTHADRWPRSADCHADHGVVIDAAHGRRPEGGLRVSASPGVTDARAGNRAAGQVRRHHRRSPGPRADRAQRASKASRPCPSA